MVVNGRILTKVHNVKKEGMIQAYGIQPRCCLTTKVMGTSNMTEFRKHNTQAFLRVGGVREVDIKI